MTEETKNEIVQRSKWSISPEFGNFLLTILASFLGCLVALCLYSAAVRPLMKPCPLPPPPPRFEAPMHHRGEFRPYKHHKHHKIAPDKRKFDKPIKETPKTDKK